MEIKFVITICLFFSTVITGVLAFYAATNFRTPGAKSYIGLMCSLMLYSFGYALEINHETLEGILFSLRVEYLGIPFLPVFWLMLAIRYSGFGNAVPQRFYNVLFILPVTTVVLFYTNEYHHLHYSALSINHTGPFPLAKITKGIWYHINIFYTDACFFAGNLIFLRMMLRSVGRTRKQAGAMFAASIIPWIGEFIYQSGLSPYGIDIVPFTFTLAGPLFALALFRFRMFDFVPIARHTVFDYIKDPVLVLDNLNRLEDFNKAAATIFISLSSKAIGSNAQDIFHAHPELLRSLNTNDTDLKEIRITCNGKSHIYELSVIPIASNMALDMGRIVILHDITRPKQLMEQLRELADRDGLTGIYNHRHFMELSHEEMKRMVRYRHAASLILVDLDHFKQINDRYGHQVGDEVLRRTAGVFQDTLRDCDILGRYGGEEFVVFLPETGPDDGGRIAERLRLALFEQEVGSEGRKIRITGSFGVSGCRMAGSEVSLENLCKKADDALYLAKEKGRNRVELLLPDVSKANGLSEKQGRVVPGDPAL